MKRLLMITFTTLFLTVTTISMAQINNPAEAAKNDASRRVNNDINSGIDKGFNEAENSLNGLFKKKSNSSPKQTTTTAASSNTNNSPNTNSTVQITTTISSTNNNFQAYNNYDFVPGDRIVFEDNFIDDQPGEFPSHWNLGSGQAVMNTMNDGSNAILLTEGNFAHISPLIKNSKYLSDTFTIEFESYTSGGYGPHLYFYNNATDAMQASNDEAQVNICAGNIWSGAEVTVKSKDIDLKSDYPEAIKGVNYKNKWHHIAIAFKNNQLKLYIDQYRVLVVPNFGISPGAFDIEGIGDKTNPVIIKNIRVANGGNTNMIGKKFTDTKIITHGINFDVDKATIKPESMGTLNMIVQIMKDNPDIKFEIDGHTDNTGTAAHNMILSEQRADAVRQQLITMGVDASRLSNKGFGDTKPISDNDTPEGKANNRRVEFVKL